MMKRKVVWPLALAAVALLASWTGVRAAEGKKEESEPFKRLTVDDVAKRVGSPGVLIVDGNNDDVYRDGHLPGAVHLLSQNIKEGVLPPDKSAPIIFYCHSEK
ncbi:MAG TPA: rhodanese-like domain-containing protein [Candidatus Polarisedimenticolia bacterium]|nr:rhodanese-like domain-containing protein [Candidatus Polarisedimenticolia bacterium]